MRAETERRLRLLLLSINNSPSRELFSAVFPSEESMEVLQILQNQLPMIRINYDIEVINNIHEDTNTVKIINRNPDPRLSLDSVLRPYLATGELNVSYTGHMICFRGYPKILIDDFLALCLLEGIGDAQPNGRVRRSNMDSIFLVQYDSPHMGPHSNVSFNFMALAYKIHRDVRTIKENGVGNSRKFPIFDFSICFERENSPVNITLKVFESASIFQTVNSTWCGVGALIHKVCPNNFLYSQVFEEYCRQSATQHLDHYQNYHTFKMTDAIRMANASKAMQIANQNNDLLPWLKEDMDLRKK